MTHEVLRLTVIANTNSVYIRPWASRATRITGRNKHFLSYTDGQWWLESVSVFLSVLYLDILKFVQQVVTCGLFPVIVYIHARILDVSHEESQRSGRFRCHIYLQILMYYSVCLRARNET